MSKDPAFLFYYTDFMNGTRHFNMEEKGLYITLLCEQADSETGSIPENIMKNICKTSDKQVIKTVFEKFKKDDGGYYNEVLRKRLNERRNFCESRKNNRLGKTKDGNISKTSDNRMEDENESIYIGKYFSISTSKHNQYKKTYPGLKLVNLYDQMTMWLESNPKSQKTNYDRFVNNWLKKDFNDKPDQRSISEQWDEQLTM